jgi:hypothetical protein
MASSPLLCVGSPDVLFTLVASARSFLRLYRQPESIRGFVLAKDALPEYILCPDSGKLGNIIPPFDELGNTCPDQLPGYRLSQIVYLLYLLVVAVVKWYRG